MYDISLYQIFECATTIFETFIVYQYINSLFSKRNDNRKHFICYVLFCIGLIILNLIWSYPLALAGYCIIGIYILELLFYETGVSSRIFSVFFFSILMISSEIACAEIISYLGKTDLSGTIAFGLPRILGSVISKLLQIIIVKIVGIAAKWKEDHNTAKIEFVGCVNNFL